MTSKQKFEGLTGPQSIERLSARSLGGWLHEIQAPESQPAGNPNSPAIAPLAINDRVKAYRSALFALIIAFTSMPLSAASTPRFNWERLPDFPLSAGLKGFFTLSSNGSHFFMGGSTFPTPKSEGGKKTFYDTIYRLDIDRIGRTDWQLWPQKLPLKLSEGASLPLDSGALILGGANSGGVSDQVIKADWNGQSSRIEFTHFPPLPEACFNIGATVWQGRVFIAGGHNGKEALTRFHMLDTKAAKPEWTPLPPWPGPKRFGAVLEILKAGEKEYLYLFSGKTETTNPRSQDNYLKDVYRYDLQANSWERMNDMPRAALIGIPGKIDASTLAIFSGSDGHDIERLDEIGEAYRLPKDILVYSTRDDIWKNGGDMPLGVIGVPLLKTDDGFILASGEYSPGKRSIEVYRIRINYTP